MTFELRRGTKLHKGDLKQELRRITFHRSNSMQFFSILEKAGYIEIKGGKVIWVKKNLRLR